MSTTTPFIPPTVAEVLQKPGSVPQPSRKGKKAWRKNVDITDIEATLEDLRSEERIAGGRICDQTNEQLFVVDIVGDLKVKEKVKKQLHLRIDDILADRSKVPAVSSKPSKLKTLQKHINSRAEKQRLEQMVRRKHHMRLTKDLGLSEAVKQAGNFDVWDRSEEEPSEVDEFSHHAKRPKIKPPPTMKMKPALKAIAVHKPHPGASYNPTFMDHQDLLKIAHEVEVQKFEEKERLDAKLPKSTEGLINALNPEDLVDKVGAEGDNEEKERHEQNNMEIFQKKSLQVKKSRTQRNKEKRVKQGVLAQKEKKVLKEHKKELQRLPEIVKSVKNELSEHEKEMVRRAKLAKEKAGLPRKKIGKYNVTKLPIEIQLPEELSQSLRTLKPEGNLFRDRMASLEERNIIEPRVPVKIINEFPL
ncbi:hypothetical protein G9A89_015155 [Geosiphon pyriformis]|nr:hypothetical protein G9A89_015155 [Geosiphon pyriformis]